MPCGLLLNISSGEHSRQKSRLICNVRQMQGEKNKVNRKQNNSKSRKNRRRRIQVFQALWFTKSTIIMVPIFKPLILNTH